MVSKPEDISVVLAGLRAGAPDSLERLFELVYDELRRMAHVRLAGEWQDHTLNTNALVHEAYLRLFKGQKAEWENRRHFFGAAARAMRQILVDQARKRKAGKRGGEQLQVTLPHDLADPGADPDLLMLDDILDRLATEWPRQAEVVKYRYFLGLTVRETAELLKFSSGTVENDWAFAKAWLQRELTRNHRPR